MTHSLTKIWIHGAFRTTLSVPIIQPNFEFKLHHHIKEHLEKDFKCFVQAINGMPDHLHNLFLLNPNYSVKDIFQNIKGESLHWANPKNLTKQKFSWQTGYGAFSIAESDVKKVKSYIQNQKAHHRTRSFHEEYEEFITKQGLVDIEKTDTLVL